MNKLIMWKDHLSLSEHFIETLVGVAWFFWPNYSHCLLGELICEFLLWDTHWPQSFFVAATATGYSVTLIFFLHILHLRKDHAFVLCWKHIRELDSLCIIISSCDHLRLSDRHCVTDLDAYLLTFYGQWCSRRRTAQASTRFLGSKDDYFDY